MPSLSMHECAPSCDSPSGGAGGILFHSSGERPRGAESLGRGVTASQGTAPRAGLGAPAGLLGVGALHSYTQLPLREGGGGMRSRSHSWFTKRLEYTWMCPTPEVRRPGHFTRQPQQLESRLPIGKNSPLPAGVDCKTRVQKYSAVVRAGVPQVPLEQTPRASLTK